MRLLQRPGRKQFQDEYKVDYDYYESYNCPSCRGIWLLLFLCVPWASGQLDEAEKTRLIDMFGTPSSDDVDLTSSLKPTLKPPAEGVISEEEMARLQALYKNATQPNPLSITNPDNQTECELINSKDKRGVCVPYYLCNPDTGTVIDDGATILDIRDGRTCPHYLDVCCALSEKRERPPPPPAPPAACGWPNAGAQSFRIKDPQGAAEFAEFGEFPWMVAILKRTEGSTAWSQNDFLGGGAIIHPRAVLTGAHKVDTNEASELKCRAGEYDTQTENEQYPYQERNVEKIIKHEEYFRTSLYNSIALLVLAAPFELAGAPHVGVACVAPAPPAPGARCLGMGWGQDFNDRDKYAVVLKKLELPWIPRDRCQKELRKTRLGSHFALHASLACAGGQRGRDTCRGDGGSPLVCPLEEAGRFAIFGLVAYGLGCGDAVPGVYVNVPHLHAWLTEKTRAEGLGTASYSY